MTESEHKVLNSLADAHNEFIKLPTQHPDDLREWVTLIHMLQRVVMARHAVRQFPEHFKNDES
jgi:hypothetical protein